VGLLLAAVVCGSTQVAGRGATGPAPVPPALAARVQAFMTAWQARDLSEMYTFYCEPYRQKTTRTEYLKLTRLMRFPILEFSVAGAEAAEGKAVVTVRRKADAAPSPVGVFDSESQQVWVLGADGTWCKEDEPLILPFPGPS
jgi:hypothetical protein